MSSIVYSFAILAYAQAYSITVERALSDGIAQPNQTFILSLNDCSNSFNVVQMCNRKFGGSNIRLCAFTPVKVTVTVRETSQNGQYSQFDSIYISDNLTWALVSRSENCKLSYVSAKVTIAVECGYTFFEGGNSGKTGASNWNWNNGGNWINSGQGNGNNNNGQGNWNNNNGVILNPRSNNDLQGDRNNNGLGNWNNNGQGSWNNNGQGNWNNNGQGNWNNNGQGNWNNNGQGNWNNNGQGNWNNNGQGNWNNNGQGSWNNHNGPFYGGSNDK